MRIAFFSNYLSPHQIPFSEEMYNLIGSNYSFVSCEPFSISRKKMGWGEDEKKTYELRPYESEVDYYKAKELAENSDVMVWGSANYEFVQIRIKSGKINIRYSERLFKDGFLFSIKTFDIFRKMKFNFETRSKNSFLFCASSYSPFDFRYSMGKFRKMYRWGYFPQVKQYNVDALMQKKSILSFGLKQPCVSILWAGRLIGLKHPEIAIELAKKLKEKNFFFKMQIIGNGVMEHQLFNMIKKKNLTDCVELLGAMSPEKVREYMEKSEFYLFSSDFHEGWGAVLNESMNSGCVVFCSDEVGAVHYLINDGVNGFLFKRKQIDMIVEIIFTLTENPQKYRKISINAYETINNLWSAKVAANRFCKWCEDIIKNELITFEEGPMSIAEMRLPNRNWWLK